MTTATLHKHRTITYNEKSQPISVSLNLKNRMMKRFYETLMEDFIDTLAVIEVMKNDDGVRLQWNPETREFTETKVEPWSCTK
jgi:hypothetical protein